jgi:hypothetical protein
MFHLNAAIQIVLLGISIPAYNWAAGAGAVTGVAWMTLAIRIASCVFLFCAVFFQLKATPQKPDNDQNLQNIDLMHWSKGL